MNSARTVFSFYKKIVTNLFAGFLVLFLFSSCIVKPKIAITLNNPKKPFNVTVTNVQVINNQIIVSGTGLDNVSKFNIKDGAQNTTLQIESKSANSIVANTLANVNFAAGKILDFVLSNANASSVFTVTFTPAGNSITAPMLTSMGASKGQVMKYNGTTWVPSSITNAQIYLGTWDANTNSPDLTTPSNIPGDYYIVGVAGTFNAITYAVGDWIISDGYNWQKVANSAVVVSTFNGRRGIVTLQPSDYVSLKDGTTLKVTGSSINDLADIDLTTIAPISGDFLKYNGSKWVAGAVSAGSGGTVTSVTGTLPISVASGTTTPVVSMTQATTSADGYLSTTDWNTFNNKEATITASTTAKYYRGDKTFVTLDTSVVPENTNLYFTDARAIAAPITVPTLTNSAIATSDTIQVALGKVQGQINSLATGGSNYLVKNGTDSVTGVVNVGTTGLLQLGYIPVGLNDATNKSYVDTKLPLAGGTLTGDLQINTKAKFQDSGTNTVSLVAPTTVTTSYVLTLPPAVGANNQVLTTTNTGALSWTTPSSSATPTGAAGGDLSGTYPNPTVGALPESRITNLVSDLAAKQSTTLAATKILVGSAGNVATEVAVSGDATIASTGVVTLKNTGTAGTYTSVTTDAQGRVTGGTNPAVVASITGTAPVVVTGTTTPVVSMAAAAMAVDGYLTATNWNTFNNKQSALSAGATINGIVYPANGTQTLQVPLAPTSATDVVNKAYVDGLVTAGSSQWANGASSSINYGAGNVGIGTTTPLSALDILFGNGSLGGDVRTRGIVSEYYGVGAYSGKGGISLVAGGTKASPTGVAANDLSSLAQPIFFDGTVWRVGSRIDSYVSAVTNNTSVASGLIFNVGTATGDATAGLFTGITEAMRILPSGRVGIGTPTPNSTLHVAAPTGTLNVASSTGTNMTYGSFTNNGGGIYVGNESSAGGAIISGSSSYAGVVATAVGYPLQLGTNNAIRMTIDSVGKVGIGTTTPGSTLDVKGTLRLSGATSGYVGFAPSATAGSTTYTLPPAPASDGQVLASTIAGVMSWVTPASSPVTSVNTLTGAVVLTTTNIAEGTNLYHTDARTIAASITAPALTNSAITTGDTIQIAFGKVQAQINNVLSTLLAGLSTATSSAITAADSIIVAFGKLQAQMTTLAAVDNNKLSKNSADSITAIVTVSGAGDIIVPSTPAGMTSAVNKTYVNSSISAISTLTNVTVQGNLTTTQVTETAVNLGATISGATTLNLASGTYFYGTITGSTTFSVSNFAAAGAVSSFTFELTNGGSQTVNWMSGTKWPGGVIPTLTVSGTDILVCSTRDAGVTWRCLVAEANSQ